ncbi:MAG: S-layer homology domain-containing protein, partial [Agathobaculum desmolans]
MGNIYACGAIQTWVPDLTIDPDQFEPDPPTAAPGLYKVSNNMTVKLYGGVVSTVDGKTGSETNANVIYTGGIYPSTNLEVKNAANLTVEDGQLRPSGGDINNADVIVADGAELSLVNLGDSITTNDFTGGGSVVLGETQAWTINGAVSGTTQVGVGSIFNNASQTLPQTGHTYISAPQSGNNSFTLIPHSGQPNHKLVRDTSGNWTVPGGSTQEIKVQSASLPDGYPLEADNHGAEIPVTVNYVPTPDLGILSEIPMEVKVGGFVAKRQEDEHEGYIYTTTGNLAKLTFPSYDAHEALEITGTGQDGVPNRIAPGQYKIECTIPETHTVNGQPITFSTTLNVAGDATGDIDLSRADVKVNGTYVYTGKEIIPNVTVTLNGMQLAKDKDYTVTASNNTNAGNATVTIAAVGNSGYTGSHKVPFTIQPALLTINGAVIVSKVYDGSTNAEVTSVTFDSQTNLTADKDYTATGMFSDPNAGSGKTVAVTVSLKGSAAQNYILQNQGKFELTGQTIDKASGTPKSGSMSVTNSLQMNYTYDLSQLLPDLPAGQTFGKVAYAVDSVSLGSYYTSGAAVLGGVLTLPIQSVTGQEGNIGTVGISIVTDNFTLPNATIQVSAVNRFIPQGEPVLSAGTLVYGEPLSSITLSGNMTGKGGATVSGRFVWDKPDDKPTAGTHHAAWTFTPDDSAAYEAVSGSAEIQVAKATPTGQPSYRTITTADKTLADAGLTENGATFSVPGRVAWKLPVDTKVEANTAYHWIFTPTDDANYNTLTGSIVLYKVGGSGGSGGGGAGGGGSVTTPSYQPSVKPSEGGAVTVTTEKPQSGDKVQIKVVPDAGYDVKEIIVTDKNGKRITVTPGKDGEYSFIQPESEVRIEVVFQLIQQPEQPSHTPFGDVNTDVWYYDAVQYVQEKGLMQGTEENTFSPKATSDRSMIVTILYRLAGSPNIDNEILGHPFEDVAADAYYTAPVYWARLNGITDGYSNERFGPYDAITREQLAVMLYRFAQKQSYDVTGGSDLSGYSDAGHISGFAQEAMRWANAKGLITGTSATTLAPNGLATRAQVATILMQYCE